MTTIWPWEPPAEAAKRQERRLKRTRFYFITLPIVTLTLLFVAFFVYYNYTPWELAHRQRVADVLRAQVEALPPNNTDQLLALSVRSRDGLSVKADYSRTESCAAVFAYYRQIAPTHGWIYAGMEQRFSSEYYVGRFDGYPAELDLNCDDSTTDYGMLLTSTSELCWWTCPAEEAPPSSLREAQLDFP